MSGHAVGNVSKKKSQITPKKKGQSSSEALVDLHRIKLQSFTVFKVFLRKAHEGPEWEVKV